MTGELAFFELGVGDTERGRAFYEELSGGMHGGDAGAAPLLFIEVEDMEAALEQVRKLGGEVDEMDVEGDEASIERFGRFKLCRDDQGSPFGLHQPPPGS